MKPDIFTKCYEVKKKLHDLARLGFIKTENLENQLNAEGHLPASLEYYFDDVLDDLLDEYIVIKLAADKEKEKKLGRYNN